MMLEQPIEWIVSRMGVGTEMRSALTSGAAPLGELVEVVRRYENGDAVDGLGAYHSADLAQAFLGGMQWSRRNELDELTGEPPASSRPA